DTNFWGSVNCSHFAVPHLKKSRGRIIVISSACEWLPIPSYGFYCPANAFLKKKKIGFVVLLCKWPQANKAALTALHKTVAVEIGPDVGITIVNPGVVTSEMTGGDFLKKAQMEFVPPMSPEGCAKAIVNSACRGDRIVFLLRIICPEVVGWTTHFLLIGRISKKSP
ncbi:hypothetical protein Tsubulata_011126, partial [Turnera subulata]